MRHVSYEITSCGEVVYRTKSYQDMLAREREFRDELGFRNVEHRIILTAEFSYC